MADDWSGSCQSRGLQGDEADAIPRRTNGLLRRRVGQEPLTFGLACAKIWTLAGLIWGVPLPVG
jgi:hypothetical protein